MQVTKKLAWCSNTDLTILLCSIVSDSEHWGSTLRVLVSPQWSSISETDMPKAKYMCHQRRNDKFILRVVINPISRYCQAEHWKSKQCQARPWSPPTRRWSCPLHPPLDHPDPPDRPGWQGCQPQRVSKRWRNVRRSSAGWEQPARLRESSSVVAGGRWLGCLEPGFSGTWWTWQRRSSTSSVKSQWRPSKYQGYIECNTLCNSWNLSSNKTFFAKESWIP